MCTLFKHPAQRTAKTHINIFAGVDKVRSISGFFMQVMIKI